MKIVSGVSMFLLLMLLFACSDAQSNTSVDHAIESSSVKVTNAPPEPVAHSEEEEAIENYLRFLNDKIPAKISGTEKFLSDIYHMDQGEYRYGLFDINGDGIDEMIFPVNCLYIFSYMEGKVVLWYTGTSYEIVLNNGAILYRRPGGVPEQVIYAYIVPNFYGDEVFRISFAEYHSDLELLSGDFYYFDGIELQKDQWEQLTERYLDIGDDMTTWHFYFQK